MDSDYFEPYGFKYTWLKNCVPSIHNSTFCTSNVNKL